MMMAIGAGRIRNNDEPEKRGSASKGLKRFFKIVGGLLVLSVVFHQIHRALETPEQRVREDQVQALRDSIGPDKREWINYSEVFAEVRMRKALKDPESGQFRDITIEDQTTFDTKHPGIACGYVNAKNSFGGFTGFEEFMVIGGIPMEQGSDSFSELWNRHCTQHQLS